MSAITTMGLFIITAIAEIVGCYLPYLWLKKIGLAVDLVTSRSKPRAVRLVALPPPDGSGAGLCGLRGRVRLCRSGMAVAGGRDRPHVWDFVGVAVTLLGMSIIMFAPRGG